MATKKPAGIKHATVHGDPVTAKHHAEPAEIDYTKIATKDEVIAAGIRNGQSPESINAALKAVVGRRG